MEDVYMCINYILQMEQENFIEYCAENGLNPDDDTIDHIYNYASRAFDALKMGQIT